MTLGVMVYVAVPTAGTGSTTDAHPTSVGPHLPLSTGQCCLYVLSPARWLPRVGPKLLLTNPGPATTKKAPGSASSHESVACTHTVTVLGESATAETMLVREGSSKTAKISRVHPAPTILTHQ